MLEYIHRVMLDNYELECEKVGRIDAKLMNMVFTCMLVT